MPVQSPQPGAARGPPTLGSPLSSGYTASKINGIITSCCSVACDKVLASGDGVWGMLIVVATGHSGHVDGYRLVYDILGHHPHVESAGKMSSEDVAMAGLLHTEV